ncbi:BQ2448_1868 [Microbotryum intermedium]|uniref:trimethyllysine dioxygenase n=1 Tax=Microbotryum intermedium TaxID=269621 RepID=A0A238FF23_9BASI|nr:BQ2448_1868 [Microbotryum intermedium]
MHRRVVSHSSRALLRSTSPAVPIRGIFLAHSAAIARGVALDDVPRRSRRSFATSNASASTSSAHPTVNQDAQTPRAVTVTFANGKKTSFHYLWLRDHCRDARSYHPATKQRLVDTPTIPRDLTPQSVEANSDGLFVTWPADTYPSSQAYTSFFPWTFLLEHSYEPALDGRIPPKDKVLWTSEIANDPPMVEYDQVMGSEQGVFEWVKRIHRFGFSFVRGIPPTPEATEALIRRIAFIRDTHYGGFWDFTADLKHGDLAYSNVMLNSHTDTTYFTDTRTKSPLSRQPCGLQMFHLLSPATSHKGGHNLLVDGFQAAQTLRETHPEHYEFLSNVLLPSHASGTGSDSIPSGVHLTPLVRKPVFNHDPSNGELIQVRWNGDDRGVVGGQGWDGGRMEKWFEALRLWEGVLRSEKSQLWTEMEMGTAVIFDNHRVLHGRSSFVGERRLCGAYVNHDDYRSRYVGLQIQFGPKGKEGRKRAEWEKSFGVTRKKGGGDGVWQGW